MKYARTHRIHSRLRWPQTPVPNNNSHYTASTSSHSARAHSCPLFASTARLSDLVTGKLAYSFVSLGIIVPSFGLNPVNLSHLFHLLLTGLAPLCSSLLLSASSVKEKQGKP